jgi:hypothetical protein|tara:strand:+ start:1307 stop:1420 length:114 start_codon:yes stop_codon:yes gene_type:complete
MYDLVLRFYVSECLALKLLRQRARLQRGRLQQALALV